MPRGVGPKPLESKEIGRRLKSARESVGLKQPAVAGYLAVNSTQVSKWETGVDTPKLPTLAQLAWLYGESLHFLITGDRAPSAAPAEFLAEIRQRAAEKRTAAIQPAADAERLQAGMADLRQYEESKGRHLDQAPKKSRRALGARKRP